MNIAHQPSNVMRFNFLALEWKITMLQQWQIINYHSKEFSSLNHFNVFLIPIVFGFMDFEIKSHFIVIKFVGDSFLDPR